MTPDEAFLRSILERPEDDGPRLVYADWLEENGRPERAEFIRVQIRLAGLEPDDPQERPLRLRQYALLKEHGPAWKAALPQLPESVFWGEYRRGFIDAVRAVVGPELHSVMPAILDTVPLRRLTVVGWQPGTSLAGSPLLARARELELKRSSFSYPSPPLDDPLIAEVMSWPEVRRLTHLELSRPLLSEAGVAALAVELPALVSFRYQGVAEYATFSPEPLLAAPWLRRLESLHFENQRLSGDLFCRLCAALSAGRLRRLAVQGASLADRDAETLVASGLLPGLGLLDLENNNLGAAGTVALVRALPPTVRLVLDRNPIGDGGLEALAASPLLARLTELPRGRSREIGDRGVFAVAQSPHAGRLSLIYLAFQQVSSAGAKALMNSPCLPALRTLNLEGNKFDTLPACHRESLDGLHLRGNPLGPGGLREFCADSRLPALGWLGFEGCALGPDAARSLADAPGLPALKQLDLTNNPLGDAGAIALAGGGGLPALEELRLRQCQIGDAGIRAWMDSPRLATLKKIDLTNTDGNPISKAVYEAFRETAWRHGCDVDSRSRKPPPLRAIRRGPTGLASAEDRLNLARWIDRLWFAEYHTVGWLKAVTFENLRKSVDKPADLRLLDQYGSGEGVDNGLQREMIRLFLREWLVSTVPESVGVWGLEVGEFRPVGRAEALTVVDAIVATSVRDERAAVRGHVPPCVATGEPAFDVADPEDEGTVPYAQLRSWFADELFDLAEVAYFVHTSPGGPTVRFDHTDPRVVGMDRDVIAMLWLE